MKKQTPTADEKIKMIKHLSEDLEPIQLYALRNGTSQTEGAELLADMVIEECPFCCRKNGIVRTHEDVDLPKCWNCLTQVERCGECDQLVLDYEIDERSGWCAHCIREGEEITRSDEAAYRQAKGG